MRHLIAILLLTLGVATARAADVTATVPGYGVTYFDLLQLAIPGMTLADGRGRLARRPRASATSSRTTTAASRPNPDRDRRPSPSAG